ncbi:hypothetical protein PHMEG_00032941 [Phytophthora megakarya]|uniref:Reverse transcriptase n=1 Tax=Phytophthora megakarya TaxID=4795 RepID=A0A225UUU7_9STRA|nr:hypothetical protein PHMEG_00032941 [Phytophthora megakarya]
MIANPGYMSDFFRERVRGKDGSDHHKGTQNVCSKSVSARLGRAREATYLRDINTARDLRRDTVLHGPRLGSEIHTGGCNLDEKYKETISRSVEMAISDPETLRTGTGQVNQRLREVISDQADPHNYIVRPHQVETLVYLNRVREGYTKKLAHLWHGPFCIDVYAVKLEIAGSTYNISPVVHVSKVKPVRDFPARPVVDLTGRDQDRLDFDEALVPGDS